MSTYSAMMWDVGWGKKKKDKFSLIVLSSFCYLGNNLHPVTFQKLNLMILKLVSLTIMFLKK